MDANKYFQHWYFNVYVPEKYEEDSEEYSPREMVDFAEKYHEAKSKESDSLPCVSTSDFKLNQKVKRNYPESWIYWVSEVKGNDVLIRTTEDSNDPQYDDFWVKANELHLC